MRRFMVGFCLRRGVGGDVSARRGGVRVQRGLRRAVMRFGRRRAVRARAARGGAQVQRGGVSGARLAVQAARRWHSLLHRCQTMQPHRREAPILRNFFSERAHCIHRCYARGGARDCEGAEMHDVFGTVTES